MIKTRIRRAAWLTFAGLTLTSSVGWAQGPPTRQGLLSLEPGRIFYEVVGEGAPVVVLHGGPGLDHNYLRPGLDVLAASSSLIYFDQRGTGRSDSPLDSEHISLTAFLEDIEALRQVLGHDRVTVLGHSYGSLLALAYAMAYPDRTRALVLMAPVEPGTRWQEEAARRAEEARDPEDAAELARLAASPGYEARDPNTVSEMYRLAFRSTMRSPDRVDEVNLQVSRATAANGPEVARLLSASLGTVDWWDELTEVEVPTLVIHGAHDVVPRGMSEALASALPRGQLAVLETGHFPYVEDPGALVAAVAGFLAGIGR